MANARLIVCEKSNYWAVALRWAWAGSGIRVHETRNWVDCRQEMDFSTRALLALEMRKDNVEEVCQRLIDLRQDFPKIGSVVLAERELSEHEWTLRELGVLHVVLSRRNLAPLARLAERFLGQATTGSLQNPRDSAWRRLPWPEADVERQAAD